MKVRILSTLWVIIYVLFIILKEMKKIISENLEYVIIGGFVIIIGMLTYIIALWVGIETIGKEEVKNK